MDALLPLIVDKLTSQDIYSLRQPFNNFKKLHTFLLQFCLSKLFLKIVNQNKTVLYFLCEQFANGCMHFK